MHLSELVVGGLVLAVGLLAWGALALADLSWFSLARGAGGRDRGPGRVRGRVLEVGAGLGAGRPRRLAGGGRAGDRRRG